MGTGSSLVRVVPHSDAGWEVRVPGSTKPLVHASTSAEAIRRARPLMLNGGTVHVLDADGSILHRESVPAPLGPSRLFIVLELGVGALVATSSALRLSNRSETLTVDWIALVAGLVLVAVSVVMLVRRRI